MAEPKSAREIFDESARHLAWQLNAESAIVIVKDREGRIGLVTHGFETHAAINEQLAVGIHMNLSQHDQQVLAGAAGPRARQLAEAIERENQ